MMDVLLLSRIQFAMTCFFHFIFVPLTLGLSVLIALMQLIHLRTGEEEWRDGARFFGKLFLINFAIGIVTGITLEFQFGTNWSRYAGYVGDIFGSLLAVEASVAFFLESTFIAVWAFGWDKVSRKLHCTAIWIVALASNFSAFWILVANAWMQRPVGYVLRNGRAELDDFLAVITQPYALIKFAHAVSAAWCLSALVVLGISAWHLRQGNTPGIFQRTFRLAGRFGLVSLLLILLTGHFSAHLVAANQPTKFAAMEAHWETMKQAPVSLLAIPDEANEKNHLDFLQIPGLLSFLARSDFNHEVKGLKDFPAADRPPVRITFFSFRIMVALGGLIALALCAGWWWGTAEKKPDLLLRLLPWAIPLPYLANELGWTVADVGRQPWVVYGLMRTGDGVSTAIDPGQVLFSLVALTLLYTLLGLADGYLLFKFARKIPESKGGAN